MRLSCRHDRKVGQWFVAALLVSYAGICIAEQSQKLIKLAEDDIKKRGLSISAKLNPTYFVADLSGDGKDDVVFFVQSNTTGKLGVCIVLNGSNSCTILGAGNIFFAGGDDFSWADKWKIIQSGRNWETRFSSGGEIVGVRKVLLKNKGIELCMNEDGCGIITRKGDKYIWIHHAD